MTIYEASEYINCYDSGQEAVNRSDYRTAYYHFMACLEYKKTYECWDESSIRQLEYLVKNCNAVFK